MLILGFDLVLNQALVTDDAVVKRRVGVLRLHGYCYQQCHRLLPGAESTWHVLHMTKHLIFTQDIAKLYC